MSDRTTGDRTTPEPSPRPARTSAAARRRVREQEILAATRSLFDSTGVGDVQIEDIAREVGINRAIIYRHFSGKDELFALTVEGYLAELQARLEAAAGSDVPARERLAAVVAAFVDYGLEFPAFVDCAQALMRLQGSELEEQLSEAALFRLGRGLSACLRSVITTLDDGAASGDFDVEDSTLLANYMYASALGALQLARIGMLVGEAQPGVPTVSRITGDDVRRFMTSSALALAGAR